MEIKNYEKLKEYYVGIFKGLNSIDKTYFSELQTAEEKAEAAIKSSHWDVKVLFPSMASALNNMGYLNVGICPLCGETPIGKDMYWKYAWDWNNGTNLNLCQACYKKGINETGGGRKGCYIATVCYGSEFAENVKLLKFYRDHILNNNVSGRTFIKIYYTISPSLSKSLRNKELLNKLIRYFILDPFVARIKKKYNLISEFL